ncbi:hypothetical protein [Paraburkholderia sediminicola]|uniref:hypothetical protein n=1 Tax=Paraburkholderia sediminicola TaxID=458836 RepID=UPI000EADB740
MPAIGAAKKKGCHRRRANKRAGALQALDTSFHRRSARNKRRGKTTNFAIDSNFGVLPIAALVNIVAHQ